MKIRFYHDHETDAPHIYRHNLTEHEVMDVLAHPGEDRLGHDGVRVAIGQTRAGRYLRVDIAVDVVAAAVGGGRVVAVACQGLKCHSVALWVTRLRGLVRLVMGRGK